MTTVRKSLGFVFLERYLLLALNLLSFTLLARLLTPEEIGLYSVSMALISICQVIRDFGLVSYLIQRKTLERDDIAVAFGLSLLLGGGLFLVVGLGAPLVGQFYRQEALTDIVHIIALNFLIMPFSSIIIAVMRREMQFNVLMRINIAAGVGSTSITLGLAWAGMGSWSLAWGEVVSNLVILAGALMAGGRHYLQRPHLRNWRAVVSFGGPVTMANIVTAVSMDINSLVVGKVLNFTQVAVASRAQGLMNLFHRDIMGTIRTVAYPAFARLHREGHALEHQHTSSLSAVLGVAWPFYGFVALFSLEVLHLMFGPQWDAAAQLVPWFCLAGAFSALNSLIPTLMLAAGHSRLVSMADLIIQPIKALALIAAVYFYRDLISYAIVFAIIAALAVPYFYAFKQACLPTNFAALVKAVMQNSALAGLSLGPAAAISWSVRPAEGLLPYPLFFACVAVTTASWLLLLWFLKHTLFDELVILVGNKFPSLALTKATRP
ncbi:oligosaccharide flippase family protein [Massilia yuzhufengensis]|uniref:Membrane protein involved in the export of O-antigen and teichoic acid n=1 Tax=Massilia yuzhufengensis TaxID=1164594 RepID=A0A1I1DIT8_9BURK|nr:oligosaccharide flippase family protein [Massilia yuzhufengensis]SFB74889.1 Membrane protein involved in the export of O-antigen and teichoic acid [Massilia yuzhufengensis]